MQTKLKFLLCALLVLVFAVSQVEPVNAQSEFNITVDRNEVAAEGQNQVMGTLVFSAGASAGTTSDLSVPTATGTGTDGTMTGIVISYDGLVIANDVADLQAGRGATCGGTFTETAGTTTTCGYGVSADEATTPTPEDNVEISLSADRKKLMIMWGSDATVTPSSAADTLTLNGIRVDVSSKDAGDEISVSINAVGSGGAVDIGGGTTGSASTVVSTARAGLTVPTVTSVMLLTCDGAAMSPSIKVQEGFGDAWEDIGSGMAYAGESTQVFIQIQNVPAGVTFKWPKTVSSAEVKAGTPEAVVRAAGRSMLTLESGEAGNSAIYSYSEMDDFMDDGTTPAASAPAEGYRNDDVADSFTISPEAKASATTLAGDTPADAWAYLYPSITSPSGLQRRLSYKKMPMTDENADSTAVAGEFVSVADCVTYLLFPYVTCSGADWTTGFAIANTTKDDMVFGRMLTEEEMAKDPDQDRGGATGQSGAVYVYGYPMSPKAADGGSGTVPDGMMTMVSSGLSAGDTLAIGCDAAGMSGMDGYAIVEARFQEATGMAFVLGNFADGAAYDVAHGYMAEVIGTGNKMRD